MLHTFAVIGLRNLVLTAIFIWASAYDHHANVADFSAIYQLRFDCDCFLVCAQLKKYFSFLCLLRIFISAFVWLQYLLIKISQHIAMNRVRSWPHQATLVSPLGSNHPSIYCILFVGGRPCSRLYFVFISNVCSTKTIYHLFSCSCIPSSNDVYRRTSQHGAESIFSVAFAIVPRSPNWSLPQRVGSVVC